MAKKLTKKGVRERVQTIEAIYQEYLAKLDGLRKKQFQIIDEFIKKIEERKIEEIKKELEKLK